MERCVCQSKSGSAPKRKHQTLEAIPTPARSCAPSRSKLGTLSQKRARAMRRLAVALARAPRQQRWLAIVALPKVVRSELFAFMTGPESDAKPSCKTLNGLSISHKESSSLPGRRAGRCSIERVRRGDQLQYRVAVLVPCYMILMKTQYVASLESAIEMCVVLVR